MNNTAKPSTTLGNTTRTNAAELWSTITTTWASETRTWLDCGSLMDNTAKRLLGSYTFDEMGTFTPDQLGNATFDTPFTPITNTAKP